MWNVSFVDTEGGLLADLGDHDNIVDAFIVADPHSDHSWAFYPTIFVTDKPYWATMWTNLTGFPCQFAGETGSYIIGEK